MKTTPIPHPMAPVIFNSGYIIPFALFSEEWQNFPYFFYDFESYIWHHWLKNLYNSSSTFNFVGFVHHLNLRWLISFNSMPFFF